MTAAAADAAAAAVFVHGRHPKSVKDPILPVLCMHVHASSEILLRLTVSQKVCSLFHPVSNTKRVLLQVA